MTNRWKLSSFPRRTYQTVKGFLQSIWIMRDTTDRDLLDGTKGGDVRNLEILSYVCVHHKDYRRTVRQYLDQDIFLDLGFTFDKRDRSGLTFISKGYASKIINGTRQHAIVSQRLLDPSVRQKIESSLNITGLFSCTTGQEIDKLVFAA